MKTKNYFFLIWTISLTMNFSIKLHSSDDGTNGIMLDKFVAKVGKKLGKKYRMSQCGSGGGVNNGIWLMSLDFQKCGEPMTEEKARKLIIVCLNDYLEAVNKDEVLKPFLKVYPFKPENIDMDIYFASKEKKNIFHPFLTVVSANQGNIEYFTKEELNRYGYKSEKYETYDEAIAILQKERNSC